MDHHHAIEQKMAVGKSAGIFTDAVLDIRSANGQHCQWHCGTANWFDLASLTKPLLTGLLCAQKLSTGQWKLNTTLKSLVANSELQKILNPSLRDITLQQLLQHTSGLEAVAPWYQTAKKIDVVQKILQTQPIHQAGIKTIYSDAGFILLGWLLSEHQSIADQAKVIGKKFELNLQFGTIKDQQESIDNLVAKTGFSDFRQRYLCGEVHDDNAYMLGDRAGHAGLFATAATTSFLALLWLQPDNLNKIGVQQKIADQFLVIPKVGRPLAWDKYDRGISQAGDCAPENIIGHLGFTGTSVWLWPRRKIVVTLLTNRIACDQGDDRFKTWRPQLHDIVWRYIGDSKDFFSSSD